MADLGTDCASTFGGAGGALDVDRYFRRITGNEAVAHAVARRLVTARGSMSWAPDVGFDVRSYLNESLDRSTLLFLSGAIRAEAEGDERVRSADVRLDFDQPTGALTISLSIVTGDGPFTLVLRASALSVSLLSPPK